VGVGNVGKRIAALAQSLNMPTLLCDPPRAEEENNASFVTLDTIAEQADIITFHVPLTHEGKHATAQLAGHGFFERLRKPVIFINTSRGEVVDEAALRAAAGAGKIQASALDVWENEPYINAATLQLADIGTPHIAGYSAEGKSKASEMAIQALSRFFDLPLRHWQAPVLPPVVRPTALEDLVNADMPEQALWYRIYRNAYDILADDRHLRRTPHQGEQLRNHYEFRRELTEKEKKASKK
jgi:erythronate-4-phosphate dehydrogenase